MKRAEFANLAEVLMLEHGYRRRRYLFWRPANREYALCLECLPTADRGVRLEVGISELEPAQRGQYRPKKTWITATPAYLFEASWRLTLCDLEGGKDIERHRLLEVVTELLAVVEHNLVNADELRAQILSDDPEQWIKKAFRSGLWYGGALEAWAKRGPRSV